MSSSSVELHDSHGLVFGYHLTRGEPLASACLRGERLPERAWLHFNLADGRARAWLSERGNLSQAALAVLLDPQPRVRMQLLPEGVAGIVEDLHHDFNGDAEGFGELRLYVDAERVISARRHPLKTVDVLRRELKTGTSEATTRPAGPPASAGADVAAPAGACPAGTPCGCGK